MNRLTIKKMDFYLQVFLMISSVIFVYINFTGVADFTNEFSFAWGYWVVGVWQTLSSLFFPIKPSIHQLSTYRFYQVGTVLVLLAFGLIIVANELIIFILLFFLLFTPLLAFTYLWLTYQEWQKLKN